MYYEQPLNLKTAIFLKYSKNINLTMLTCP